mmetsp:Transcript_7091/g.15137  ORF Transcript_7091/g.15137 Transcript_7091/m.15137 type:complete len:217 (-) Transcript_7091:1160-1810(-)
MLPPVSSGVLLHEGPECGSDSFPWKGHAIPQLRIPRKSHTRLHPLGISHAHHLGSLIQTSQGTRSHGFSGGPRDTLNFRKQPILVQHQPQLREHGRFCWNQVERRQQCAQHWNLPHVVPIVVVRRVGIGDERGQRLLPMKAPLHRAQRITSKGAIVPPIPPHYRPKPAAAWPCDPAPSMPPVGPPVSAIIVVHTQASMYRRVVPKSKNLSEGAHMR